MNRFITAIKNIPTTYYNWKKRNENLSTFLEKTQQQKDQLDRIEQSIKETENDVHTLQRKVDTLEERTALINGRIEVIGKGTKMELFDTLHSWRTTLVLRGWATPAEKREVEEIWRVYHFELNGNGQGERYYNEIIALPESEEEMIKLKGGK